MDAKTRRNIILETISTATLPLTASTLAERLEVSRQIIVGDVALLRAQGHDIIATARGYVMYSTLAMDKGSFIGKIACQHTAQDTFTELSMIVNAGAAVVNVIIDHDLYGEITGQLNITTKEDVAQFVENLNKSQVKLLSELKGGVHLHTIACQDKAHFDRVYGLLEDAGFIYAN